MTPAPVLARFGPPVAWMGVIAVFSSSLFGADRTEPWVLAILGQVLPWASPPALYGLHAVVRKMGHVAEYGILAALWMRAFAPRHPPGRAAVWAVTLSVLYAGLDEARQGLTPNRSPSAVDVAIDTAGALLAVGWLRAPAFPARAVLRLVRWAAVLLALASLAAALVDWSLGLPAWDLVLAAMGLALLGWTVGRVEHAWRNTA